MRSRSSCWSPVISASAITSAITPTVTPSVEMNEITEMNACFRLANRYRSATCSSKGTSMLGRHSRFLITGKRITSRIDGLLVRSMTSRSMPTPSPPVGGSPYSSARM